MLSLKNLLDDRQNTAWDMFLSTDAIAKNPTATALAHLRAGTGLSVVVIATLAEATVPCLV